MGVPLGDRRGSVGKRMEMGLKGTSRPQHGRSLMLDWAVCFLVSELPLNVREPRRGPEEGYMRRET